MFRCCTRSLVAGRAVRKAKRQAAGCRIATAHGQIETSRRPLAPGVVILIVRRDPCAANGTASDVAHLARHRCRTVGAPAAVKPPTRSGSRRPAVGRSASSPLSRGCYASRSRRRSRTEESPHGGPSTMVADLARGNGAVPHHALRPAPDSGRTCKGGRVRSCRPARMQSACDHSGCARRSQCRHWSMTSSILRCKPCT